MRDNLIVIASDIQCLKGTGTEYLVNRDGDLLAIFVDGDMFTGLPQGNTEITKAAA